MTTYIFYSLYLQLMDMESLFLGTPWFVNIISVGVLNRGMGSGQLLILITGINTSLSWSVRNVHMEGKHFYLFTMRRLITFFLKIYFVVQNR